MDLLETGVRISLSDYSFNRVVRKPVSESQSIWEHICFSGTHFQVLIPAFTPGLHVMFAVPDDIIHPRATCPEYRLTGCRGLVYSERARGVVRDLGHSYAAGRTLWRSRRGARPTARALH